MRRAVVLGLSVFLAAACAKEQAAPAPTVVPDDVGEYEDAEGTFEFVSTERNAETEQEEKREEESFEGDPVVTSAPQAHEVADAAVADRLNPRQQWVSSPVMPVTWPGVDRHVNVYFFPMAANPNSLSNFQLFSPQYVVTVSLDDGTGEVKELDKRKLGMIVDTRPSRLEREEREMAEAALVHYLLTGDPHEGENSFWGYLKFFHEHPKLGKDMKKRHPGFVKWLEKRKGFQ